MNSNRHHPREPHHPSNLHHPIIEGDGATHRQNKDEIRVAVREVCEIFDFSKLGVELTQLNFFDSLARFQSTTAFAKWLGTTTMAARATTTSPENF